MSAARTDLTQIFATQLRSSPEDSVQTKGGLDDVVADENEAPTAVSTVVDERGEGDTASAHLWRPFSSTSRPRAAADEDNRKLLDLIAVSAKQ